MFSRLFDFIGEIFSEYGLIATIVIIGLLILAWNLILYNEAKTNFLLAILSMFIPIIGIVLYFVLKDNKPNAAEAYLGYGIAGFIIALMILLTV